MEVSEKSVDAINDLIKINNDRAAGFEKAGKALEGKDNELIALFDKLAAESRQYASELTANARQYNGDVAEGTSASGDLHRAWIDIKTTFTGNNRLAILNECERGEDAAKSAYRDALDPENQLSSELTEVLQRQEHGIMEGHNTIRSLRDQMEANEDRDEDGAANENTTGLGADPARENNTTHYQEQSAFFSEPDNEEEESEVTTGNSKLMEFFVDELKDLLWAERELVESLPDMAEAATSANLKMAFEQHLTETDEHVTRLEQVFGILGLEPETRKCEAMAGIIDEGDEIISATGEGTAQRDVGLIFAGQKVEHYEIASYGGMIALAKTLGYYGIAETLVLTLDEEKAADAKLTEIAENEANYAASNESAED